MHENRVTQTLNIPWWPFTFLVFLGCGALLIVLLRDLLDNVAEGLRSHFGARFWLLMFGTAVLVVAGLALFALFPAWKISPPAVGITCLVLFFLFFFAGMPIAFVMLMVGFVCTTRVAGVATGFDIMGSALFTSTASFTWAALALFVLMAFICFVAELGADLFTSANKWIGHIPGGLGIATIAASTGLAAIVGDPSTPAVATGAVAIPEMRRFKYSDTLATGAILGGGTIGAMIPPSLGFIIYGLLAEASIGDLFVAGIIPGLLLSGAFIVLIYALCRLNPKLGPPGERASWGERLISLKAAWPVAVLFLLVIGGIYLGVFTPSEGGGVGAFGAFLIALGMKRLTWKRFVTGLTMAGRLVALGFMMIGGAMALSYFFALSRLPDMLMDVIARLPVPSIVIIIVMLLVYLVLGCVMDPIPLLLLTVPIFAPMAKALGYDPIWLGVLVILTSNVGFITPPYAGSIFMLRGAFPDIPIGIMYRGVLPFVLASAVVIAIIVAFPSLATWIPYLRR
jgi:tripartite ATP-independent transporter DctM subunit